MFDIDLRAFYERCFADDNAHRFVPMPALHDAATLRQQLVA
ncbi:hypothetical protein ACFS27_02960 [Promicromonospora vindobonensis]|uniref:Uncharacterized protein n=1 Tax=Promicromonospora vindobonensis TaxID=195748 RepID=A0ABW5VMR3_9MICO